jgi:subtilisin family serine protease
VYKDEHARAGADFKPRSSAAGAFFRLIARSRTPVEVVQTPGKEYTGMPEQERQRRDRQVRTLLSAHPALQHVNPVYYNPATKKPVIVTGNIILKCASEANNAIVPVLRSGPLEIAQRLNSSTYLLHITAASGARTLDIANRMSSVAGVEWAEPEFYSELDKFYNPDDPWYPRQQHLKNTGQNGGVAGADIKADFAWDIERGDTTIKIALIDDGVPANHPDLRIAPGGKNYVNSTPTDDFWPQDPTDMHGTSCAGVAAAVGGNGTGVSGVAGRVSILPIKIATGTSYASNTNFGNAITYGAANADIISISWGWNNTNYIRDQIRNATKTGRGGKGCPVFIAAGNGSGQFGLFGFHFNDLLHPVVVPGTNDTVQVPYPDGSYYLAFGYRKDTTAAGDEDLVAIDNVKIIDTDGYTLLLREPFASGGLPAGWTTNGDAAWFSTPAMYYGGVGDTLCVRSGVIGKKQNTELRMPLRTFHGNEMIEFMGKLSTRSGYNRFLIRLYDNLGTYLGSWGGWSGIFSSTTGLSFPASVDSASAIGASTDCDFRSGYSQYASTGKTVEFVAPSSGGWNGITTVDRVGADGYNSGGDYTFDFGGTSSATPTSSGVAALILSMNPSLTRAQVLAAMRSSCDKIGNIPYSGGKNTQYGNGRINAYNALRFFRPVISSQAQTLTMLEDHSLVIPLSALNITDPYYAGPFTLTIQTGNNYASKKDTLMPATDYNGTLTVRVTVSDGHLSSDTFSLSVTVTPVNDAPSFIKGPDIAVDEDAGPQTVASWATALSKGPANESGQTLHFVVTNDHAGLFSAQPAISAAGDLSFTSAKDSNGVANVRVVLKDDGGTANGGIDSAVQTFVITMRPVNDPPMLVSIGNKSVYEGQTLTFDISATDPDRTTPSLYATPLPSGSTFTDHGNGTGTFSWTPLYNQSSSYTVVFSASDGVLWTYESITITVIDVAPGSITINSIGASAQVFLYATSGWYGKKMLDGPGTMSGIDPGNYVMAVRENGKRTEYVPTLVVTAKDTSRTLALRPPVPLIFDKKDTLKSGIVALNTGGFANCAFGDFDGDGSADLVAALPDGTVKLYHAAGGGYTLSRTVSLGVSGVQCVRVADWNGDGLADLVVAKGIGDISVFINNGAFAFAPESIVFHASMNCSGFDICDVNNDSKPDFLLGYQGGGIEIAASSGAAWQVSTLRLPDGTAINAGPNAGPMFIDISGDGQEDLAAGNNGGEVRWYEKLHDSVFIDRGFLNSFGSPLTTAGAVKISRMYGSVGDFQSLVLSDASGLVYKVNALLKGDFFVDPSNTVDIMDLSAFGDAWQTAEGAAGYMPQCNLDLTPGGSGSQVIDIFDLAVFGDCFGKSK